MSERTNPPAAPPAPWLGLGSGAALDRLAEALPDALFTTDGDGRITSWNAAAERITGWPRAEALGRECSLLAGDAIRGCGCGGGSPMCARVVGRRASRTCTIRRKDGRLRLVVKSAVPLLGAEGRPVGTLETFADVGEGDVAACPAAAPAPGSGPGGLLGAHPEMVELRRMIGLVAGSDVTVLVSGESGSGKDRVTEAIHAASRRAALPLVRIRCGAGAGAAVERALADPAARTGTLLVDELADLAPADQARLLRLAEGGGLERADGSVVEVRARLVCTTARDVKALVDAGRFRADLFFRLAVFPLHVPALREHAEDIPLLAEAFLAEVTHAGARRRRITGAALAALAAWGWPGNVRELRNAIRYAALRAGDGDVDVPHLPRAIAAPGAREASPEELRAMLEACGWNRAEAARRLRMSRVTLWKRIKALGLTPPGDAPPKTLRPSRR